MTKGPATQGTMREYNSRHNSINPECIRYKGYAMTPSDTPFTNNPKNYYAFTLNPIDELQCFYSSDRIKDFKDKMLKQLHRLRSFDEVQFTIEVSGKGRLHLHGRIRFKSREAIMNFYVNEIMRYQTSFSYEIDSINDVTVWDTYMNKQALGYITKKDLVNAHSVFEFEITKLSIIKQTKDNDIAYLPFEWEDERVPKSEFSDDGN